MLSARQNIERQLKESEPSPESQRLQLETDEILEDEEVRVKGIQLRGN